MKTFILPDYIDSGKVNKTFDGITSIIRIMDKVTAINENHQLLVDFSEVSPNIVGPLREEIEHPTKKQLYIQLMLNYKLYKQNQTNYVLSKPIIKCFENLEINLDKYHLPDKFSAYIETPGVKSSLGYNVIGCFCSIFLDKNSTKLVNISLFSLTPDNQLFTSYLCFVSNNQSSVTEQLNRVDNDCINDLETRLKASEQESFVRLILNTILFITSDHAELIPEKNEFSKKKSKRDSQLKIYTEKNWIMVGKNFHSKYYPRGPLECGEFEVSGHYRWQACGFEMKNHKLIFINPYMKGLGNQLNKSNKVN